MRADFRQCHFDIDALLLQGLPVLRQHAQEAVHLSARIFRRLVHVDQALDLR